MGFSAAFSNKQGNKATKQGNRQVRVKKILARVTDVLIQGQGFSIGVTVKVKHVTMKKNNPVYTLIRSRRWSGEVYCKHSLFHIYEHFKPIRWIQTWKHPSGQKLKVDLQLVTFLLTVVMVTPESFKWYLASQCVMSNIALLGICNQETHKTRVARFTAHPHRGYRVEGRYSMEEV